MPISRCITEADLRAFQLGELPERLAEAVTRHLEECPACEALACGLDALSDPILDGIRQPPGADGLPGPTRAWVDRTPTRAPASLAAVTDPQAAARVPHAPGYTLLEELGRGGMSVVYLARQESPQRLVALKMILGGAHADAERRARLRAEADAIARLQHPNIVTIYEVGEHAGMPYLALEYVAGGQLSRHTQRRPQPAPAAAALVEKLWRAPCTLPISRASSTAT
jgi:hypothetical protein